MNVIEELNKLVENGTKVRAIERAVKFPENQLSAILKGLKKLPKKWEDILGAYVALQDHKKRYTVELPVDYIGFDKIGIVRADGTFEELKGIDQLPPSWVEQYFKKNPDKLVTTQSLQPKVQVTNLTPEPQKSNYTINTEPPVFKNDIEKMVWEAEQKIKNKNK